MPKIFYTERDIEDLYHSGVTTLVVNDDVKSPSAAPSLPQTPVPAPTRTAMEDRVLSSVKAKVGDTVDPGLLKTIIQRVLKSVGGS